MWVARSTRAGATRLVFVPVACALLLPAAAGACPVCFSAVNEDVLNAYYLATAGMTLMPLLLVGGIVAWLRRQARAAEE